ncbi:MAG: Crp/Fnr family transcriptional regulator [Acidobacteriota bacterium]
MLDAVHNLSNVSNRLLSVLPKEEFVLIQPHLKTCNFRLGQIIYNEGDAINNVYFPQYGMISLLSVTQSGHAVEVGYTSEEGMLGLPIILGRNELPYQAMAQSKVECLYVESEIIVKLFGELKIFHDVVLRYVFALMKQLSQTGVCNHFHTIETRLCRWLLIMRQNAKSDTMQLTQEFLSHMLGVQRTSIGFVAGALQTAGIIRYRRGKLEILDIERLEECACECYHIVEEEYNKYLYPYQ